MKSLAAPRKKQNNLHKVHALQVRNHCVIMSIEIKKVIVVDFNLNISEISFKVGQLLKQLWLFFKKIAFKL